MSNTFEVNFLGTNGSCAYNGGNRQKYGTNSICVVVRAGEETLAFDAGTGICGLREVANVREKRVHLFFSHYHLDHINGLLFCYELFDPTYTFHIYGSGNVKCIISEFLSPPLHPVGVDEFQAKIEFHEITSGETLSLSNCVQVRTLKLIHPGESMGYRVDYDGKIFCFCTDAELSEHQNDDKLLEFTQDANLLVLDSFFEDGKVIPGWGHASPSECAEWAVRSNVKKLALFHHNFRKSDEELELMEAKAKDVFPNTFLSFDRMRVTV